MYPAKFMTQPCNNYRYPALDRNGGKTFEIVHADGSTEKLFDTEWCIFQVLPKLFVDFHDLHRMKSKNLAVRGTSDALGNIFEPQGGIVVRQPLPNRRYFVGGSQNIRYGWIVPIPDHINQFDLTMERCIAKGAEYPNYTVRHTLLVQLLPGEYHTYSMDLSCWHPSQTLQGCAGFITSPTQCCTERIFSSSGMSRSNTSTIQTIARKTAKPHQTRDHCLP
jgi:hypothetical protein